MEPLKNGTKYTYLFLEGVPWGKLSDPNMDPEYLAHLVMVWIYKKSYRPSTANASEGQVLPALPLPRWQGAREDRGSVELSKFELRL